MIEVFLEEMHFKFLNYRNGPTNDYWTRTKYTSIIKKLNRGWEMYNVGMLFLCSLKKMWNIFEI